MNIYKHKYIKYKKKYINQKRLMGGAQLANKPVVLTPQYNEGELWFYGSTLGNTNNSEECKSFSYQGHLGISFDKTDLLNENKKIYAFGPKRNYGKGEICVPGDIRDDVNLFRKFYKECNQPLYKINIKYDKAKATKFMEYVEKKPELTYSDPFTATKEFYKNFESKEKFNNCITFITHNIEPIIDVGDGIKIEHKSSDKFGFPTHIPGGWISQFVEIYKDYAEVYREK